MSDKKTNEAASGKSKMPMIVIAIVALAVIFGGGYAVMSKSGEQSLNDVAPASADSSQVEEEKVVKMGNPVVATVNGEEIKRSDVLAFISALPEQVRQQMPMQTLFPLSLEQVINNKILSDKAVSANLAGDPEVTKLLEQAKAQIERNVFLERQVDEQMDEKKLKKAYDEVIAEIGDVKEIKASHILVDSKEKADAVIAKLKEGADFAGLAKESSAGETATNGGDLGWFAKNEMVPEFAEAAFSIKAGDYSKEPVQTQFGWHVIKVYEGRDRPKPSFDALKPQLEAKVRQDILNDLVKGWNKNAKVEKFDINGEPVKK